MVPSRQCRGNTCVKLNHCTLRTRACARCVRGAVRCSAGAVHLAHDGARNEEEHQADVRDVGRRVGRQADQGAAVVLGGKGSRRRARGVAGGSLRHLSWSRQVCEGGGRARTAAGGLQTRKRNPEKPPTPRATHPGTREYPTLKVRTDQQVSTGLAARASVPPPSARARIPLRT